MTKSVVLKPNSSWNVYVGDKEVLKACSILSQFSSPLSSNKAVVSDQRCRPGNYLSRESRRVHHLSDAWRKNQEAQGNRDTIVFVDNSPVVDSTGKGYSYTDRKVDCDVIRM